MFGGLPGAEWNPWQEDYDHDGMGDACDPCPFHPAPPGTPCVGVPQPPQPEQWSGIAGATTLAELPIYGSERLGLMRPNVLRDTAIDITREYFTRRVDEKEYELKDHLGNVRVVVSDMKTRIQDLEQTPLPPATFELRVKSVNAYYAFGMLEEGMSGSSEGYRYGYNGKEMDNEIKGVGNSLDYGARMYDPRLGRFMSTDPLYLDFAGISSYVYAGNSPIIAIDKEGEVVDFLMKDALSRSLQRALLEIKSWQEILKKYNIENSSHDIYINYYGYKYSIEDYIVGVILLGFPFFENHSPNSVAEAWPYIRRDYRNEIDENYQLNPSN